MVSLEVPYDLLEGETVWVNVVKNINSQFVEQKKAREYTLEKMLCSSVA